MSFPVVFDKPSDFTVQMECVDLFNAGYSENFVISHSYNDLSDKPKLNGQTIQGDIDEIDPTVPEWAKSPKKRPIMRKKSVRCRKAIFKSSRRRILKICGTRIDWRKSKWKANS